MATNFLTPGLNFLLGTEQRKLQRERLKIQQDALRLQEQEQKAQQEAAQQGGQQLMQALGIGQPMPGAGEAAMPQMPTAQPPAAPDFAAQGMGAGMGAPLAFDPQLAQLQAGPQAGAPPTPPAAQPALSPEQQQQGFAQAAISYLEAGQPNIASALLARALPQTATQRAQEAKALFEAQKAELGFRSAQDTQAIGNMLYSQAQSVTDPADQQRWGTASILWRAGQGKRAMEVAFPNIVEPTNLYQDLVRQGKSPQQAAAMTAAINRQPNTASMALACEGGDQKSCRALGRIQAMQGRGETVTVDKDGTVTISKGRGTPLSASQRLKAQQNLIPFRQNQDQLVDLRNLLIEQPDVVTVPGRLRLVADGIMSQAKALAGKGGIKQEVLANVEKLRGQSEFAYLATALTFSQARIQQGGGVLTQQDVDSVRDQFGFPTNLLSLTSPAQIIAATEKALEQNGATFEHYASILRGEDMEVQDLPAWRQVNARPTGRPRPERGGRAQRRERADQGAAPDITAVGPQFSIGVTQMPPLAQVGPTRAAAQQQLQGATRAQLEREARRRGLIQ